MGASVNIYNRVYHLHGCDAFTRDFMAKQGKPQAEDTQPPQDPYHNHLQQKARLREEGKARVQLHEKPTDSRYYLDNARKVCIPSAMLPWEHFHQELRHQCWRDPRLPGVAGKTLQHL